MDEKKVALVTGAYQGIGKGIADMLAENGYLVIYSDVFPNMEGVEYIKLDISKTEDREAVAKYIDDKYHRLNLLVNNAGVACKVRMDILETTEESFDRLININTKGTFFMCQKFANLMIGYKSALSNDYRPRIVNIASNSSYTSSVSRGEYCISKAGVSMVTTLFADKLGEYDIPVLEVRPGIIKTPMTEVVTAKYDKLIAEGITPVKRWGTPEDVAKAVLAVAEGLLDFSTGTAINVDGGFHIKRL
ncbi:MAG: 3-ketoacyl-ACP reductase [Clostridia bacterium]|nr:3-ketoacyl-ACP reductase [Clostridia bacterium]